MSSTPKPILEKYSSAFLTSCKRNKNAPPTNHKTQYLNMNFKICALLLACISAADASSLRGSSDGHRGMTKRTTICFKVASDVFKTRFVTTANASTAIANGNATQGACVCKDSCAAFPSFNVSDKTCSCTQADVKPALQCGVNAEPTNDGSSCRCLPGFTGNASTGCTDVNECAANIQNPNIRRPPHRFSRLGLHRGILRPQFDALCGFDLRLHMRPFNCVGRTDVRCD